MDILKWLNAIILSIGLPTLIGVAIKIGRKLQVLDDVKKTIGEKCNEANCHERMNAMETLYNEKINVLMRLSAKDEFSNIRNSPRQLNNEGNIVLNHSGFKEIIDSNIDYLFKEITNTNPRDYYEVEFQSEKIINKIKTETNLEKIKSCAERVNIPIEMLLVIGSVYLSNKYLEKYPELTKEDKENDK